MRKTRTGFRILAILLVLVMALALLPLSALAAGNVTVTVTVENATYPDGVWAGILLDHYVVTVPEGTSLMAATVQAFEETEISENGSAGNYIDNINGLSAFDGGGMSGWMITVNDWFINMGADDFTAEDGDEIRWMYTLEFGEDIGGSWGNGDTSLIALEFSAGTLDQPFSADVLSYTLTLPAGTDSVTVTPAAANKNYQVRTNVDGAVYKRSQPVPVADGTVIKIGCGDPSWPSMNYSEGVTEYLVTVAYEGGDAPAIGEPVTVYLSCQLDDMGFYIAKQQFTVEADLAERFGYTDDFGGEKVSALDAIVAAHIAVFGDDENDIHDALAVNGFGFITNFMGIGSDCVYIINGIFMEVPSKETELQEGDYVQLCAMQDAFAYSDTLAWFEYEGAKAEKLTVEAGQEFGLTLMGEWFVIYGERGSYTGVIEGAGIVEVEILEDALSGGEASGYFGEPLAVTGGDGAATLSFEAPGTYILSAIDYDSDYEIPIMSPWLEVTVTEPAPPALTYREALENSLGWIVRTITAPTVDSVGGEWSIIALARYGVQPGDTVGGVTMPENYYSAYLDRVTENAASWYSPADSIIHNRKATDNERVAIALASLGIDAAAFGQYDLLLPLSDLGYVTWQGNNAITYALVALDTHQYAVPALPASWTNPSPNNTGVQSARANIIAALLNNEANKGNANAGGWVLGSTGTNPDVDTTAMAIQALAPYYNDPLYPEVKPVVDRALVWLSNRQQDNGHFTYGGNASSESAAQVLAALCSLDIDPLADARFIKDGNTVLDALLSYYVEGGGFKHLMSGNIDAMATDQASYALVAYDRYVRSMNTLYDMSDTLPAAPDTPATPTVTAVTVTPATATVVKGGTQGFAAAVTGDNEPAQTVIWSVNSTLSSINASGVLTVAASETATSLTVTATSTADSTKSGTAAVAVSGGGTPPADTPIYVTFRLVGSRRSTSDVDLTGDNPAGYHGAEYVTWIPTAQYAMRQGDTNLDLFTRALSASGLQYSIRDMNNYVEAVWAPGVLGGYKLAEFTNGRYSGWMYTVNGSHPGFGLKEFDLHDGDVVIWHYVNDYRYEVKDWFSDAQYPALGNGSLWSRWLNAPDTAPNADGAGGGAGGDDSKEEDIDENKSPLTESAGWANPFADVGDSDWFYDAVAFVQLRGLMNGVSGVSFAPGMSLTRGMFVTMLYRSEGTPEANGNAEFTDVAPGQWYTDAVAWASGNGIVTGYGGGLFGTNDNITREQLAVMLYNYAKWKGIDVSRTDGLTAYTDADRVSDWAGEAMAWAIAEGLITGRTETTLAPKDTATRAETAMVLMRFINSITK